ncbi:MAG: carbon-nitrogen hydrolase family protein [Solimonas sp.]
MGDEFRDFTLAAIQAAPVYLDRESSVDKACRLIDEAGAKGADLTVFGETWIPGYAEFAAWPEKPGFGSLLGRFILNAVEIPSPATDALCRAAARAGTDVAIGVAERDATTQGSVYCTLLFIGREGKILGKHRKLKPTFFERTVWGEGDGSTLRLYERPYGKLGGLNCWEHQMVLPGYALIAQGLQVHAAAWPGGTYTRQEVLSRAFAMQATAYVVMAGGVIRQADIPADCEGFLQPKNGHSAIIAPNGDLIAGPLLDEEGILTAKANLGLVMTQKMVADHAGHYARPDVFDFRVNRTPKRVATFLERGQLEAARDGLNGGIERHEIRNEVELRGAFEDLAAEARG